MFKNLARRAGAALSAGRKAFTMTFSRATSYFWLPSSRFNYGDGSQAIGNSIVGACVLWFARAFPEAPFQVLRMRAQKWTAVPLHGLSQLIERPNPYYPGPLLWMATIIDFLIFGNAYWVKVRNNQRGVIQLWWIPYGMIEPKRRDGSNEFITHYEYRPGREVIDIDPADVVHFRFGIDPENTMKGFQPVRSLLREIFTDDEAANYAAALLRNLGVPGVVISPDSEDIDISPEDAADIREEFGGSFGGDNRGRAMVLSAKSKIQPISFSPEQMNLREVRRIPEERVSAVIGIPAVVVGLGAGLDRSTYNNMGEAKENAWEMGIIPTQRLLSATLDVQLLPDFEPAEGWRTGFDLTQVRALQDDVDKLATRTDVGVKGGYVEVYEARQNLGLEVDDSMHYYLRGVSVVEVMADEAGANAPEPAPTPAPADFPPLEPDATDEAKAWRRVAVKNRRTREAAIRAATARLASSLADLGERVAGKASKAAKDSPAVTDEDVRQLTRLLRGLQTEAVMRGMSEAADDLDLEPIALDDPAAVSLLDDIGVRITGINEETRRRVADAVTRAQENGDTSAQLAEQLRNDHAFSAARAATIARTELTNAENLATVASYRESGLVDEVDILDGDGCGWEDHNDPDLAHGSRRKLADFEAHTMAHPNCVRVGTPVIDVGKARRNGHRERVKA